MRLYAIGAVLFLSLATFMIPQHPDRVRGRTPTGDELTEITPEAEASSPYDDATVVWDFNDNTDLGADNGDGTYDLTLVNVPTATGGALGYATDFASASTQYADGNDINNAGSGVSWGYAAWVRHASVLGSSPAVVSKLVNGATSGDYDFWFDGNGSINCRFHDGTSLKTDQHVLSVTVEEGIRYFVTCRYNATANELRGGEAGAWSAAATSTAGDGTANAASFNISGYGDGTGELFNGSIGPVWYYYSASGGEVLTDAYATSLYNIGKGKTCADTTETTNLVSCWEMSEDGGPYVDSVGSNDLTAVNTPTRVAGLVERSDSGMAVNLVEASTQYLSLASFPTTGEFHTAGWLNIAAAANNGMWGKNTNSGAYSWGIHFESSRPKLRVTTTDGNTDAFHASALNDNEWHFVDAYFDVSEDEIGIAVDNGAYLTGARSGDVLSNQGNAFWVGAYYSTSFTLSGVLDNIAVWDARLSSDAVAALYASGAGLFYSAYWDAIFKGPHFAWSKPPERRRIYAVAR